jgi:predicted PurR-regulated permease PerM
MPANLHPYRVVLFTAAVVAGFMVVPKLASVGFALFLTVVFALILDAPVSWAARRGMKRGLAVGLVVTAFLGLLGGFLALVMPTALDQIGSIESQGSLTADIAVQVNALTAQSPVPLPQVRAEQLEFGRMLALMQQYHVVESTGQAMLLVVFSAVAAAWAVINPVPLQQRLLSFLPAGRRSQVASIGKAVEERLRRWLLGQLILCAYVGVTSYLLFRMLGVPYAELFAVLAAVFEVVPTAGVIISSIGPALLLLLEDPRLVLYLVIGVAVIQQMEDRVLVPVVMKKAVDIPQTLLLFVTLTFGLLFGVAGLIMAVPLTAAAFTVHDEIRGIRPEDLAGTPSEAQPSAPPVAEDGETAPA